MIGLLLGALAWALRQLEVSSRLQAIEEDLDCDISGSLAESIAELHAEILDLKARVDEWSMTSHTEAAAEN